MAFAFTSHKALISEFFNIFKIKKMKQLFALFLLLSLTSFSQIPTSGLIGGWPFTGNANDMSGSGNHGTVTGATLTTDRFGAANCAYSFNGTSDYITMLSAGPTGSLSRSVSFWEKSTYTVGPTVGFTYGQPGSGGSFQINFNYNCQAVGIDNSSSAVMHGTSMINGGQWHHIVIVFDSSIGIFTGNVMIYIDGSLQSAISCVVTSTNSPFTTNALMPVRIGRDNSVRYFKGDLDDFYFYNRAITSTEVLQLYNYAPCTAAPSDPGTIFGSSTLCSGSTTIYSVAPVPGASSYTWSLPGGWTGTSSSNTISVVAGASSGSMSVIAGNPCGNSQQSNLSVTVNPSPTVSITAGNAIICKGNSTVLTGNGASTYTWNSFINTPSITISPTVSTSFTLDGTNSFGCTGTTVKTITVTNNPLPTISVSGPTLSCSGQNISLASNGASTYTWQPGSLNGFLVSVSPTATTVYTVTGTDANGCYNSATYTQSVSACTGINSLTVNNAMFRVYPNPFTDVVSIQLNKNIQTEIEVYSVSGKLLLHSVYDQANIELDLSKLNSGIYFIKLKNSEGTTSQKIIKLQ
jgi:hypothetical protein